MKSGRLEVKQSGNLGGDVPRGTLEGRCAESLGGCEDAMELLEVGSGVKSRML